MAKPRKRRRTAVGEAKPRLSRRLVHHSLVEGGNEKREAHKRQSTFDKATVDMGVYSPTLWDSST